MILTDSYELIYTNKAQPQHILRAAKSQITEEALESVKAAEYLLDNIFSLESATAQKERDFALGENRASANRILNQVEHIHANKADEIRSRFQQPMMTEKELEEMLFDNAIRQRIESISKGATVTLG